MGRIRASHGFVKIPQEQASEVVRASEAKSVSPAPEANPASEAVKIPQEQAPEAKSVSPVPEANPASEALRPSKRRAENLKETGEKGDTLRCKQFKGEGKGGSLGVPVEEWKQHSRRESATTKKKKETGTTDKPTYPTENTRKCTSREIEELIGRYYTKPDFPFVCNIEDMKPGDHVLWQGVPCGPNGGESTKEEFFHGVFHRWEDWTHASIS